MLLSIVRLETPEQSSKASCTFKGLSSEPVAAEMESSQLLTQQPDCVSYFAEISSELFLSYVWLSEWNMVKKREKGNALSGVG